MHRRSSRAFATGLLTAALLLCAAAVVAQDSLSTARDLYTAAAYDDALARLNELRASTHAPADDRVIEQYRALCLFALGRPSEAERAIESMVTAAPAYRPTEGDASPRVQAAFADVRRRVLPAIIEQKYSDAKAAFDRHDLPSARAGFTQVIELLGDPAIASGPMQQQRASLLTLASGFRDLSTPVVAPPPPVVPSLPQPQPPPVAVVAQPPSGRIYGSEDPAVVAPVAVRQSFAALSGVFALRPGAVEIVIDETGAIADARIRIAVNPVYDRMALATAKTWRYRPATVGGVPVKFRKVVQLDPKVTQ